MVVESTVVITLFLGLVKRRGVDVDNESSGQEGTKGALLISFK